MRRTKPKGQTSARRKRLTNTLGRLRDEREEMIGTRSIEKDPSQSRNDGGYLGRTQEGLKLYQEQTGPLAERVGKTLPGSIADLGLDLKELQIERATWAAGPKPDSQVEGDATGAVSDNGLADLLKEQLTASQQTVALQTMQAKVFDDFAPLAYQRLLGSFARGTEGRSINETGLAVLHKDETVIPDAQGPFGNALTRAAPAAPIINVYVDGDAGPIVRRIRAEIDGRAAQVVGDQLGRRARRFAIAGGR